MFFYVVYGSLALANHLSCPQFEDLAPMMSPGFVHHELESIKLNVCVKANIVPGKGKEGEAVADKLL